MIHHGCFFDILNISAWNAGLTGKVSTPDEVTYNFKMEGPVAAVQQFVAFVRFANGALGTVVNVIEEDAVVPQTVNDHSRNADSNTIAHMAQNNNSADDAVVPSTP